MGRLPYLWGRKLAMVINNHLHPSWDDPPSTPPSFKFDIRGVTRPTKLYGRPGIGVPRRHPKKTKNMVKNGMASADLSKKQQIRKIEAPSSRGAKWFLQGFNSPFLRV